MIAVRHAVLSDKGLRHECNEDRWFANPTDGLYFVSDGMANEPTPQFVLDRLPTLIHTTLTDLRDSTAVAAGLMLQRVVCELNNEVRSMDAELRKQSGIVGATLVMALVRTNDVLLSHVGDSRIYLHRAGALEQLTQDHSLVQDSLTAGKITATKAGALGFNGGPSRYIGMRSPIVADVRAVELLPGDRLLLCSDGLVEMLPDEAILTLLNESSDLDLACQALVAAANTAGGFDNVTVLLIGAESVGHAL
ncbi:MAG TPA: SpoIIE family protein phosphatase [Gemmataceae bacterium]|nr:SpoIIE family protein phosphatase [Gemmataceae bacterium]